MKYGEKDVNKNDGRYFGLSAIFPFQDDDSEKTV